MKNMTKTCLFIFCLLFMSSCMTSGLKTRSVSSEKQETNRKPNNACARDPSLCGSDCRLVRVCD